MSDGAGLPVTPVRKNVPVTATGSTATTFYDEVGGEPTFRALVQRFYAAVRTDPVLQPMYPQDDWEGAESRLRGFLEQYWGGPTTYSEQRGHPRLRMRHMPFTIGPIERDAWLKCMRLAVDDLDIDDARQVRRHLERFVMPGLATDPQG